MSTDLKNQPSEYCRNGKGKQPAGQLDIHGKSRIIVVVCRFVFHASSPKLGKNGFGTADYHRGRRQGKRRLFGGVDKDMRVWMSSMTRRNRRRGWGLSRLLKKRATVQDGEAG